MVQQQRRRGNAYVKSNTSLGARRAVHGAVLDKRSRSKRDGDAEASDPAACDVDRDDALSPAAAAARNA